MSGRRKSLKAIFYFAFGRIRDLKVKNQETFMKQLKMVAESIEIDNSRRPHLSLKYRTPDEIHQAFA